jgi:AmmeMemoRadiSam system protein B
VRVVEDKGITMCGVLPTAVALFAAKSLGAKRATLLKHCHSAEVTPMRKAVGYASVEIEL